MGYVSHDIIRVNVISIALLCTLFVDDEGEGFSYSGGIEVANVIRDGKFHLKELEWYSRIHSSTCSFH